MIHIFHKWELINGTSCLDEVEGSIRKCVKCGKKQEYRVWCLSLKPAKYTSAWVNIPGKKVTQ